MFKKPYFWIAVWLVFLSIGPITILKDTPLSFVSRNSALFSNFLQRIAATLAFTMMFFQVVLGSLMPRLVEKLGSWIFKFHITEGPIAYALIFLHPIFFFVYRYFALHTLDPFYIYTQVCVICTKTEFFYSFGRVAFWLVSLAVVAAWLRTEPWWRDHWRKFHIANYFVFFLVAIHSWFVGTDAHFPPFVYFWWFAVTVVLGISIYKLGLSRRPVGL